ncbi:COX15/CtaA family protein [Halovenus rubra]|uniref:COX15/CtaA family protein n=2 Tax=Halovenus rubra TaxID=869890 RepID=A0ACC7DYG1_9EURY|nr:COX15/CtaA family protein [Halovenus rubra]
MRVPIRHYLATTTVSTFFLILLGVYTGKIGAGLTCEARWPLCDGWMGLFPANWLSFVEWFHRLVAMIVGFMILGGAIMAWRRDRGRILKFSTSLAVVFLPVQVFFGANTVLNFGVAASMMHQFAAQMIFGLLVVSTTFAYAQAKFNGSESSQVHPNAKHADD